MAGSEFVEVLVGVGSARIRDLFKRAKVIYTTHFGCDFYCDLFLIIVIASSWSTFFFQSWSRISFGAIRSILVVNNIVLSLMIF